MDNLFVNQQVDICAIPTNSEDFDADGTSFRIKINGIPRFYGTKEVKKILNNLLGGVSFRKIKISNGGVTFVSFTNDEDTRRAISLLNGFVVRKTELTVSRTNELPESKTRLHKEFDSVPVSQDETDDINHETKGNSITPLSEIPYLKQLEIKQRLSDSIFLSLLKQSKNLGIKSIAIKSKDDALMKILRSPIVSGYRNKTELTIGYTAGCTDRKIAVGFVIGKQSEFKCSIVPVDNFIHITHNTKQIAREFEDFINTFDFEPFDDIHHRGFWRTVTIRDFLADCMVVVGIYLPKEKKEDQRYIDLKKRLSERFISSVNGKFNFHVTSVYLNVLEDSKNPGSIFFEHIAGTPFVYERLLGLRFRISPPTFFQTNTKGTEILYSKIFEMLMECILKNGNNVEEKKRIALDDSNVDQLILSKRQKLDSGYELEIDGEFNAHNACGSKPREKNIFPNKRSENIVILDICCGAGTIGQCILKSLRRKYSDSKLTQICCVGVELVEQACNDARTNAWENGLGESCVYIAGSAERLFPKLSSKLPHNFAPLSQCHLLGVIDPPRAGINNKVMIACRNLEQMRSLVYVSCNPRQAMKNILDLCRPTSNKYEGRPFTVSKVQPVDLFPQTQHVEWAILLTRC